eukprot:scaffold3670_cov124-Cylindrotheca_fusiformis.AAC.36
MQPYSVRIGRGKTCSKAIGNRRLQVLASSFLEAYRKTSTKIEKSLIVTKIVDMIQEACPVGAFVRYQDGRWWEVDDFTARDKVGSTIRDLLSDEYRSSSKAKFARRKRQKQDSLTTGKVAAVVSNLDALSSDLPPCPQDQQKKMTVAKDPPQHQEVSEQGDNVAWSSESQGLDDEGLLFPIHGSSTKTQTAQRKKQRQDSLTDGTKSVIDSILDLRSSDLLFCPQDHQEKNVLATKNPPPIHHSLSSESRRLNDGNGMKPLGILVQQGRQSSLRVQMGLDGESQQPPRSRSTKTPVPEIVGLEQKQSSLTTGTASVFGSNFYLMSLDLPLDPQDCQEMILGTENSPPEHQAVLEQGDRRGEVRGVAKAWQPNEASSTQC